ncbi:MAG: Hpt domain-containing protein, partial [Rhodospirillales bacterium]|nr:Hpt domain-containing protein [Rhodospirillales bacterium]
MDDDFLETLWSQFSVESKEHLDLIEPLLIEAENQGASADAVAQLFRSFHSLKGLSRAMDFTGMERLAHSAEDLLGLVREGRAPLSPEVVELLLEGVDNLKSLRDMALADKVAGPVPADLVGRLDAIVLQFSGGAAG